MPASSALGACVRSVSCASVETIRNHNALKNTTTVRHFGEHPGCIIPPPRREKFATVFLSEYMVQPALPAEAVLWLLLLMAFRLHLQVLIHRRAMFWRGECTRLILQVHVPSLFKTGVEGRRHQPFRQALGRARSFEHLFREARNSCVQLTLRYDPVQQPDTLRFRRLQQF